MAVDRLGLKVNVRTIERTIVDLFDRYDLAGGAEELFNSLDLVARVDARVLVRYARALGNATAAGALGSWLESEQKRLGVPDTALAAFRTLAQSRARYALGTKPGEGRVRKGLERHPPPSTSSNAASRGCEWQGPRCK